MSAKNLLFCTVIAMTTFMGSLCMNAQQRDVNTAMNIAKDFVNQQTSLRVKGLFQRQQQMKLVRQSSLGAYYMFSTSAENGFVIVSGDERMIPILGYSDSVDGFDIQQIPENMANWLAQYDAEYEALQLGKLEQQQMHRTTAYSTETVSPIVTAAWGQSSPFNNDCPLAGSTRCVTGCVSVAMSQVMYTYQYPQSGIGSVNYTTPTRQITIKENLANHPFNWTVMQDNYNGQSSAASLAAVSNLCYMAASAVHADFNTNASGASTSNTLAALVNNFGYDADVVALMDSYADDANWHQIIQQELLAGRPVIYFASTMGGEGHTFLVDGYTPPTSATGTPYYHINWGWEGNYNANFALNSLKASGYNFSTDHVAVIGVKPDDGVQQSDYWMQAGVTLSNPIIKSDNLQKQTINLTLFNAAYRTFNGTVTVRLVSPDGSTTNLGSYSLNNMLTYQYATQSLTFQPKSLLGTYRIEVWSKAKGQTVEHRMLTNANAAFQVISADGDLPYKQTDMQAQSMAVQQSSTSSNTLTATLTGIINMANDTFNGTVALAVTNTVDTLLLVQDGGQVLSGIGQYKSLTTPVTLTTNVPSTLADGHYRLHAVSCQTGYSGWSYMRQWARSGNSIVDWDEDLYTDFWMQDGTLYMSDPGKIGAKINLTIAVTGKGSVTLSTGEVATAGTHIFSLPYNSNPVLQFGPDNGQQMTALIVDGADVLDQVGDLAYVWSTPLTADVSVTVNYDTAINFMKQVTLTYNADYSSVSRTSDGGFAKGSVLAVDLHNGSGVTITEQSLCLSDGLDGARSNSILKEANPLNDTYTRGWDITLSSTYANPIIYDTFRVRGQDYTLWCSPSIANGVLPTPTDASTIRVQGIYTLDGKPVTPSYHGICVIRYSDGHVEKQIKR